MRQTTLEAWLEWKARCALALCEPSTTGTLTSWAAPIFRAQISRLMPNHPLARAPNEHFVGIDPAWASMEVHLVAGKKAAGKRYKDSLFAAAEKSPTDEQRRVDLERYFARTCQHEARRLVACDRGEIARARAKGVDMVSLHAPIHSGDDAPTFEQLYVGADNEGVALESAEDSATFEIIIQAEAKAWFEQMGLREKLVLGCHGASRSLADPEICRLAGCGKSQMYASQAGAERAWRELAANLEARYAPENDEQDVKWLVKRTLLSLFRLCMDLLPPEKRESTDF